MKIKERFGLKMLIVSFFWSVRLNFLDGSKGCLVLVWKEKLDWDDIIIDWRKVVVYWIINWFYLGFRVF